MSTAPYIEQPLTPTDDGVALVRPPHRMALLMRVAMRFIGLGLLALGGLLWSVCGRLDGANIVIAALLGVVCFGGGVAALWWMGRSGGVRRVEIDAARLVLYRAGFAGIERRLTVDRAAIERLDADAIGEGRMAQWRVWLVMADARVELATLGRSAGDTRPVEALAGRLGVLFTPRD